MLTTTTPVQMELYDSQYSDGLLEGTVLFDLLGNFKKGDRFRSRYTEIKFGHGCVMFQTPRRVVLIHIANVPTAFKSP
jgi:hypothetical protein